LVSIRETLGDILRYLGGEEKEIFGIALGFQEKRCGLSWILGNYFGETGLIFFLY